MIMKRLIVGGSIVAVVAVAARFLAPAPELAEAPAAVAPSREARPPRSQADAPAVAQRSVEASRPASAAEPPTAPDASRRFIFDCGNGVIFSVRTVPGEATLFSSQ